MLPNSLLNPDGSEGIPQGDGEYDTDTEGMEDDYDDEDSFRPLYTVNTDPLIEARGVAYVDGEDPLAQGARGVTPWTTPTEEKVNHPWKLVKRNRSASPIDRKASANVLTPAPARNVAQTEAKSDDNRPWSPPRDRIMMPWEAKKYLAQRNKLIEDIVYGVKK